MIEDDFKYADRSQDPRYNRPTQTKGLVDELESLGIRPFTEEW